MSNIEEINPYNRRWSTISFLYGANHIQNNMLKSPSAKDHVILRRRSAYFYVQLSPGSNSVFLPDSLLRELWEIIGLIMIVYENFFIIYLLTFTSINADIHFRMLLVCDFFFMIEMILNFNTGYFFDGMLIKHRTFIIKRYLCTHFMFDFLACFPFQLIIKNMKFPLYETTGVTKIDVLHILWFFKIFNNLKLKSIFENFQCYITSHLIHTIFHLVRFLTTAIILVHWTACLMYLTFYKDIDNSGMLWDMVFNQEQDVYLKFFYFMVTTTTSTGYGDISSYTIKMKALNCFFMCLACWLFAFLLSNSKSILLKYQSQEIYFAEKLLNMKKFIKMKKINTLLKLRILSYLKYLKNNLRKSSTKEDNLLSSLSTPLQEEVFTVTRGKLLKKCPVFSNYSPDFLRRIIRSLTQLIYAPKDIIICDGDRSDSMYFITKGRIEMFHQKTQTVFKELKQPEHFGEIGFFLQRPRACSARSLIFSYTLCLARSAMISILKKRPSDYSYHKSFVHQAQMNLSLLSIRCYLCKRLGHLAKNCQQIVIVIDKKYPIQCSGKKSHLVFRSATENENELDNLTENPFPKYEKINVKGQNFDPTAKYKFVKGLSSKCKAYMRDSPNKYKIRANFFRAADSEESETSQTGNLLRNEQQYTERFIQSKSQDREHRNSLIISNLINSDTSQEIFFLDLGRNIRSHSTKNFNDLISDPC